MDGSDLVLTLSVLAPVPLATAFVRVVRSQRGRTSRLGPLVAGNVLLLATLLSLVFVASEVYYRFVYDATESFDMALVSQRWFERHYRYNNIGVRDDVDYAPQVAPNKIRITVLGDSFAMGQGVARVGERFVNLLRRDRPDSEFHFIGQAGMDTGSLSGLLSEIMDAGYETDVVVYAYCLNDIVDLSQPYRNFIGEIYSEPQSFLIRNSWTFNTWYHRFATMRDPGRYFKLVAAAYEDDTIWAEQARRLTDLVLLGRVHGAQFLVVTFPFVELLDDPRYRAIHARLRKFWAGVGVPALDLLELYSGRPAQELRANAFDGHPNARAHELAADAIEGWLGETLGLAPRGGGPGPNGMGSAAGAPGDSTPRPGIRRQGG